nr:hypothetical protein [Neobacillus sp. Marseille-Q6967]
METILFIIIAGILSTFFSRAKSKPKPAKAKPFTAKGFNDIRTQFEQHTRNAAKQISTGQPVMEGFKEKYQEVTSEIEPNQGGRMHNASYKTKVKVEEKITTTNVPDEKAIINGIIWSEILSEPRAKRPYFSKKG